jgi:hypothetical protein
MSSPTSGHSRRRRNRAASTRCACASPGAVQRGLNEGGEKLLIQRGLKGQTHVEAYRSLTSRVRTMRAFSESGFGDDDIAAEREDLRFVVGPAETLPSPAIA